MDDFKHNFLPQLINDVDEGLSAPQKYLKSKYFYDTRGDILFRRITHLPEYYLTVCETEILHNDGKIILSAFDPKEQLNIVELGACDGTKAKLLLEVASALELKVNYYPIDVSTDALRLTKKNVHTLATVFPIAGDYMELLGNALLKKLPNKLILFLGSSIGNFVPSESAAFMNYLHTHMATGEHGLIGFDLVKDPDIILTAYNDSTGMTSDFNLNLLTMLNRELQADFDLDNFFHVPVYDELNQAAKSYLVAAKKHKVFFKKLNKAFSFDKGETIFTEISRNFTTKEIEKITKEAGFEIVSTHIDHREYFLDVLIRKL